MSDPDDDFPSSATVSPRRFWLLTLMAIIALLATCIVLALAASRG